MRLPLFLIAGLFAAQAALAQTSSVIAPAYKFPQVRPPIHKIDQPVDLNLQTMRYHPADISKVTMAVYTDQSGGAPAASWSFGPRDQVILLERLALLEAPTVTTPDEYNVPRKYTSIELTFERKDGRKMPRLAVFKNTAVIEGSNEIWVDPENRLEKWLFSTAETFENRVFANTALNVQTFRDCQWVGNLVVDTSNPNQCIMPDGTLFLKIDDDTVQADPAMTTYDACYKAKRPVLDEFPRKCVVPGGRVLVEPARLKKEAPAPVKSAKAKVKKPKAKAKGEAPVENASATPEDIRAMPPLSDFIPNSDVPAAVETPGKDKKAAAKAVTETTVESKSSVAAPANAKVEKLPEKTAADKPTPTQPVVVETKTGDAVVVTKTANGKPVVKPAAKATPTPTAKVEPKESAIESTMVATKPAEKAKTLPAVETPQDTLQVVPPAKAPQEPAAPVND